MIKTGKDGISLFLCYLVFTASGDGTIRAYNTKSGSCKRIFKGHEHAINALVVSTPDLCACIAGSSQRILGPELKDQETWLMVDGFLAMLKGFSKGGKTRKQGEGKNVSCFVNNS
jgi:WD40 repeat protein